MGYELNKILVYGVRTPLGVPCTIGAYNITFNKRAIFVYRAYTEVEGYSVSKKAWKSILDEYPRVSKPFKKIVVADYTKNIKSKVMHQKKIHAQKLQMRKDM